MLDIESHDALAVLWSGPGLARSVVLASSLGLSASRLGMGWDRRARTGIPRRPPRR